MSSTDFSVIPRELFRKRGLTLPKMPPQLAATLEERSRWCYSTRALPTNPYVHDHFIEEAAEGSASEYALIAHAGHGLSSSGMHYFLVHGGLALFVKIAWGGAFMDRAICTANVNRAFALASALTDSAAESPRLQAAAAADRLIVVASDLTESRWRTPTGAWEVGGPGAEGTFAVLTEALCWLKRTD